MPPDADAQHAGGIFFAQAHGAVDVADGALPGGAGRAAGDLYAHEIQRGDGLLGGYPGQQQRGDAGQAFGVGGQRPAAGHAPLHVVQEGGHQRALPGCPALHVLPGQLGGDPQPDDGGQVFRAGAQPQLLPATPQQRRKRRALAHVQRADAPGAVQLVAGQGQHIGVQRLHVHGDVAEGLHGVAVEGHPPPPGDGADLSRGLERPGLVVGQLYADQPRVRADGPLHRRRVHPAGAVRRHQRDLPAQRPRRVQHRGVLDGRYHRVAAPGQRHGLVVGLGAAGGEQDLLGLGVQQFRDRLPRLAQRPPRGPRRGVGRAGIVPGRLHGLRHRRDHRRVRLRRGRVVQVDHVNTSFVSPHSIQPPLVSLISRSHRPRRGGRPGRRRV